MTPRSQTKRPSAPLSRRKRSPKKRRVVRRETPQPLRTAYVFDQLLALMLAIAIFLGPTALAHADDASSTPATPDTTIVTGDAGATASTDTTANVTTVVANDPAPQATDASSTDPVDASTTPLVLATTTPTTLTASSTNVADATTSMDVSAATGDNGISNVPGNASIRSGNATAATNIVNVVNANIFDSQGLILFLNNLFGAGNLNMSSLIAALSGGTASSSCSLGSCSAPDTTLTVSNDNTATIVSDAIVRADTGGNGIDGAGGNASIVTGDANAAANVVNVANTNIIDSNYLMLVVNNFGGFNGNVILPSAGLFSHLFPAGFGGPTSVTNTNVANITNTTDVAADTGGNTASTTATSTAAITTGDASASTLIVNETNDSVFANDPFVILFRIHGNWNGSVLGAPDGVTWAPTAGGFMLYSTPGASAPTLGTTTIANNNTATITNNVHAYALTGDNEIGNATGTSAITTGDAHAVANIINVANENIIGTNWLLAIINIFGDWNGNVAFGMPDLWIGGKAAVAGGDPVEGSSVTYTFTVTNNGDEQATGVTVKADLDPTLAFDSATAGGAFDGTSTVEWQIGTLAPHETHDVAFTARIGHFSGTQAQISVTGTIAGNESDANVTDNTDTVTIVANNGYGSGTTVVLTPMPNLNVVKTESATTTLASSTVDYKVTITNDSNGPAYHSVFIDELRTSAGKLLHKEVWPLDVIKPHEKIELTYTAAFAASTTPGAYVNYGEVKAIGGNPSTDPFYGWFAVSNIASTTVLITPAATSTATSTPVPPPPPPAPPHPPKSLATIKHHHIALLSKNSPITLLLPNTGGPLVAPISNMTATSTTWPGRFFSRIRDLFSGIFRGSLNATVYNSGT